MYADLDIDYNLEDFGIIAQQPWLARAEIQSRHRNNTTYFVYILINNALEGRNKIIEHNCSCIVGKRTLGCCAHVMCIVWYMAWARHQDYPIPHPAAFLDDILGSEEDD